MPPEDTSQPDAPVENSQPVASTEVLGISQPLPALEPPLDEFQSMAALTRPVEVSSEAAPPPAAPAEAPAQSPPVLPADEHSHTSGLGWLGQLVAAVVSAVCGAVLALAVLAALNGGSLFLNQQPQVAALQVEVASLRQQLESQSAELETMRQRLDAFGGLMGRVRTAEEALASLQASFAELANAQQALSLEQKDMQSQLLTMNAQLETAQTAITRFENFLVGLRDLLQTSLEPTPIP
ncbi:MAG TPA: hypothetical protein PK299_11585 [Anaerolineales bacterium]|nr:hypothetical protein [Anaerolineales bacterium]